MIYELGHYWIWASSLFCYFMYGHLFRHRYSPGWAWTHFASCARPFLLPRRSRLERYLFCCRLPWRDDKIDVVPFFSGFMRVCGLFEPEFSSALHRRCPNPEIRYFSLCGAFHPFFGKGSPFRLVWGALCGLCSQEAPHLRQMVSHHWCTAHQVYQACFDFSNRDFGILFFYHKAPNKSITYTNYFTYNGLPVHNING